VASAATDRRPELLVVAGMAAWTATPRAMPLPRRPALRRVHRAAFDLPTPTVEQREQALDWLHQ